MSAVAHFFMAVSGSFIHERMAQLFIDIYMYFQRCGAKLHFYSLGTYGG